MFIIFFLLSVMITHLGVKVSGRALCRILKISMFVFLSVHPGYEWSTHITDQVWQIVIVMYKGRILKPLSDITPCFGHAGDTCRRWASYVFFCPFLIRSRFIQSNYEFSCLIILFHRNSFPRNGKKPDLGSGAFQGVLLVKLNMTLRVASGVSVRQWADTNTVTSVIFSRVLWSLHTWIELHYLDLDFIFAGQSWYILSSSTFTKNWLKSSGLVLHYIYPSVLPRSPSTPSLHRSHSTCGFQQTFSRIIWSLPSPPT